MKPCDLCGVVHSEHQAHRFPQPEKQEPHSTRRMANAEVPRGTMANSGMANTVDVAGTYRYRDAQARRKYQRELMRVRRAAAKGLPT